MSDVLCSWGCNIQIHSVICLVPWEVEISLLSMSLCPLPPPRASLQWAFQKTPNIRAYQASACIILAYILFTKLSVQVGGTVCVNIGLWKFIGNCLQNNNLQSASLVPNELYLSHMCGVTHVPKTLSLMNLWHLTWNWSTESSHLNQIQVEMICSERVLSTQRSVKLREKWASSLASPKEQCTCQETGFS